jgi:hypothetical protein
MLADTASAGVEARPRPMPRSHAQALQAWRTPEDIAAWSGTHFRFDAERALLFSATHRRVVPPPTIADPEAFFAEPVGICLDLSRFAVQTLRRIDPAAQARYLMVEFEPVWWTAISCGCTGSPRFAAADWRSSSPTPTAPAASPAPMPGRRTSSPTTRGSAAGRCRVTSNWIRCSALRRAPRRVEP